MPLTPNPRRRALLAICAVVLLLMLPNLTWLIVGEASPAWLSGVILPVMLLAFLFALFGRRIWLACLILAPFVAIAPVETFYIARYLHPTNAEILATLIATNPREIYEYLGPALLPFLACIVASLIVAILATRWTYQTAIEWQQRSRAWIMMIGIGLPLIAASAAFLIPSRLHVGQHMVKDLGGVVETGYPFGLIQRVARYRREWQEVRDAASGLESFRFHAHALPVAGSPKQIYVLVIGESSRRDHWQLFGYPRSTTPELSQISNLVPITNMVTAWPVSVMAIPLILTRKPITDTAIAWKEASILRAMQEAGFDTWWISNQLPIGKYDSPVATYALEADHSIYLNHASLSDAGTLDEVLLQPLREVLEKSNRNLFIVLHMMGSHLYYDTRYPPAFKIFKPVFDDKESKVLTRVRFQNSYDNTIIYTDHILAKVIGIIRKTNSISAIFYASDHGETLPTSTCSKYGHGNGARFEFEIPALFWYSDEYEQTFPQRVAALRANAGKPTMNADTFESLIDMAGIDFPGHDPRRSLFSTHWQYRQRIVSPIWQVNFDEAVFDKKCNIVLPAGANTN